MPVLSIHLCNNLIVDFPHHHISLFCSFVRTMGPSCPTTTCFFSLVIIVSLDVPTYYFFYLFSFFCNLFLFYTKKFYSMDCSSSSSGEPHNYINFISRVPKPTRNKHDTVAQCTKRLELVGTSAYKFEMNRIIQRSR